MLYIGKPGKNRVQLFAAIIVGFACSYYAWEPIIKEKELERKLKAQQQVNDTQPKTSEKS